jgi:hypothetical protein
MLPSLPDLLFLVDDKHTGGIDQLEQDHMVEPLFPARAAPWCAYPPLCMVTPRMFSTAAVSIPVAGIPRHLWPMPDREIAAELLSEETAHPADRIINSCGSGADIRLSNQVRDQLAGKN